MHMFYMFNIFISVLVIINAKNLYSDLLTNDNELFLLDSQTSSSSSSLFKRDSPQTKHQKSFEDTTVLSKIVVNILYKNKSNQIRNTTNKMQQKTIIYSSNKLTSCDKNFCKSNEICVLKKPNINDTKDYSCLPKINKQISNDNAKKISSQTLVNNKNNNINNKNINNMKNKSSSHNSKCSNQTLINLKITLFEILQRNTKEFSLRKELISKVSNKFCLKTILNSFAKLDLNMDLKLSLSEWSKLEVTNLDTCAVEFFNKCDSDLNEELSVEEMCNCFDGIQHKCNFIKNSHNSDALNSYVKSIEKVFVGKFSTKFKLANRSYMPICDSDGYFKPLQCDRSVNCWCVDKEGNPIVNTFRKIDQDPIECYNKSYRA